MQYKTSRHPKHLQKAMPDKLDCSNMMQSKCCQHQCMCLQTDPHLSRTVVVSTKLDTRLPQFARGSDVEMFLRPPGRLLEPGMLGGCPFFT